MQGGAPISAAATAHMCLLETETCGAVSRVLKEYPLKGFGAPWLRTTDVEMQPKMIGPHWKILYM